MQRRPLKKTAPFVLFATGCVAALAAASACSNSPTTSGAPTGGTGNVAGAAVGGGGATSTAGSGTAGSVTTAGNATGGAAGGSGGSAVVGGAGGAAGGSMAGPACKAVTPLNGSGLTLIATDISAFKYAPDPDATHKLTKMAYDPVGKVVVLINQGGKMWSMPADFALPATAVTSPLTTAQAYDGGGYAANAGYGDHRGLAFGPDGTLYVLAVQGGGNVGVNIKKGVPGAGGARTWTTLVTTSQGFPAGGTNFDHSFSGIAVSPDGMSLFISSGSRSDHGETEAGQREVPLSSAIFKVPTGTATDLKNDDNALKPFLFADGTRNAFDMAFNAAGDLIGTENGPDMDLPDEVNFLEQGKHYGFPWRFGSTDNPVRDAGYTADGDKRLHASVGYQAVDDKKYVADPAFPAPPGAFTDPIMNMGPDANFQRLDKNADPTQAGATGLAGISGHRSPLGIAFDTAGALCGPYFKQGFVLSYGSVLGAALGDPGEDLLFLSLTKANGTYSMTAKQIAKGIKSPMDSVLVGNRLFTAGYGNASVVFVFVLPTP